MEKSVSHPGGAALAAIRYDRGLDVDRLLLQSCEALRSRGLRLGGVIQRSSGDAGQCATSVHVVDLRSGEAFDIWEARGVCARGCRLDERGLLDAEPAIMAAIAERADLLVINRFGRVESLGRGLLGCFAAAMDAGVPVLTAVREPYDRAWRAFHGGLAHDLPADQPCVIAWAVRATRRPDASEAMATDSG
jgi:nucleoside-triphosphatase THEP1